jgi:hypothetical protein
MSYCFTVGDEEVIVVAGSLLEAKEKVSLYAVDVKCDKVNFKEVIPSV